MFALSQLDFLLHGPRWLRLLPRKPYIYKKEWPKILRILPQWASQWVLYIPGHQEVTNVASLAYFVDIPTVAQAFKLTSIDPDVKEITFIGERNVCKRRIGSEPVEGMHVNLLSEGSFNTPTRNACHRLSKTNDVSFHCHAEEFHL